ncbi:hypothetical protein F5884DRAFT_847663 [Xylogone sp. PMI_703]|nr:hypothetical protein F5884DRAFT_847663 [Xylogone sp. PMI_703]
MTIVTIICIAITNKSILLPNIYKRDLNRSGVMETPTPTISHQISRIRACTNCVRAKAKCSASIESKENCERCSRMNKVCQPSPPMRKRRKMKICSVGEGSKLEEKLDTLVTLLKSTTQNSPVTVKAAYSNPPQENYEIHHNSTAANNTDHRYHTPKGPLHNTGDIRESQFIPTILCPSISALQFSTEEAESYLNRFRTDFITYFPFVVILPSMTSHNLRQERPTLWTCIMAVASNNSKQQKLLSEEVREILGREAYVKGTRTIDLLQAILVYTTWDRYYSLERPILMRLIQLAIAILYDLGIDKPPSKDPALMLAYDMKGIRKPSRLSRAPTMEERRALLGCFLMSSVSGSLLRKGDTLRWTKYSNECLHVLETEKEFESDIFLVQLIKLHLISERVADAPWSNTAIQEACYMKPPASFYLRSLESQLQNFRSSIPDELLGDRMLLMELYTTELTVYEIGISQDPNIFSGQYNMRIECLYACLNSIKSWIDIFLCIPPEQYVGFSASVYVNLFRCLVDIYRLSSFEHPEWDRRLVKEKLDVLSILEGIEQNFLRVKEAAALTPIGSDDNDIFGVMASKARVIRTWWEATIADISTVEPPDLASGDNMMGDLYSEFLDNEWLRDTLGSWNR